MTYPLLDEPRVLVCGWRRWAWPTAVTASLDHLHARYDELIVIEGAAPGADTAAHDWCLRHGWDETRHRCYLVDWDAARRQRPDDYWRAGPERNTSMLVQERPRLIVAHHPQLDPRRGGTSDMCIRGLLAEVPVWLVAGPDSTAGRWLSIAEFPAVRVGRIREELAGSH